jgi:hypothetical protein
MINGKIKSNDLVCITIRKPRKLKHHNKYWLALEAFVFQVGGSKNSWHRHFCKAFLKPDIRTLKSGKIVELDPSIAFESLDQIGFEEFYNDVEAWLNSEGYYIDELIATYKGA